MMTPSRQNEQKLRQIEQQAEIVDTTPPTVRTQPGFIRGAAFFVVLMYGLIEGRPFLQPIAIAALLAFLITPLERFLSTKLRFPSALAILVSAIAVLSPFFALGFVLVRQGQGLVADFPHLMENGRAQLTHLSEHPLLQRLGISGASLELQNLFQKISGGLGQGIGLVVGGLATVANVGSQAVIVFTFSILMVASREHLRRTAEAFAARNSSFQHAKLVERSGELIQKFLIARMTIVAIVGALSVIALKAFGIQYSIFLGMLVGVMTLVPAVGFVLALTVNVIAAFIQGHGLGSVALMSGVLVVINSLENYVLTPKMVGNRLNINALASFVGLFGGGLLWGIWGMLLAIPVLGVLRIAFSAVPALQPWALLLADKEPESAEIQRIRRRGSPTSATA